MGDFQRCIELILAEEGGLANHRRDPGGLTKYGIFQRATPISTLPPRAPSNCPAMSRTPARPSYQAGAW